MSAMARGNSFLYSSDLFIPHFLTSVLIQVLEHLLSLGSDIHHHCSVFFVVSSIAVVPNLFGIRDWYRGRQFLHGLGQEGWFHRGLCPSQCCSPMKYLGFWTKLIPSCPPQQVHFPYIIYGCPFSSSWSPAEEGKPVSRLEEGTS